MAVPNEILEIQAMATAIRDMVRRSGTWRIQTVPRLGRRSTLRLGW